MTRVAPANTAFTNLHWMLALFCLVCGREESMRYATSRQRIAAAMDTYREPATWIVGLAVLGGIAWYVVFDNHTIDAIYLCGVIGLFVTIKVLHYFDRRLDEIEWKLDLLKPNE